MAANQWSWARRSAAYLTPVFADLGLALDAFVVENLSLPDELQKRLDERIGMTMVGDMGRYTQFQVAQAMPSPPPTKAEARPAIGAGLGAGMVMAQSMMGAMRPPAPGEPQPPVGGVTPPPAPAPAAPAAAGSKFCIECGKPMPARAKFCPGCGGAQE